MRTLPERNGGNPKRTSKGKISLKKKKQKTELECVYTEALHDFKIKLFLSLKPKTKRVLGFKPKELEE